MGATVLDIHSGFMNCYEHANTHLEIIAQLSVGFQIDGAAEALRQLYMRLVFFQLGCFGFFSLFLFVALALSIFLNRSFPLSLFRSFALCFFLVYFVQVFGACRKNHEVSKKH